MAHRRCEAGTFSRKLDFTKKALLTRKKHCSDFPFFDKNTVSTSPATPPSQVVKYWAVKDASSDKSALKRVPELFPLHFQFILSVPDFAFGFSDVDDPFVSIPSVPDLHRSPPTPAWLEPFFPMVVDPPDEEVPADVSSLRLGDPQQEESMATAEDVDDAHRTLGQDAIHSLLFGPLIAAVRWQKRHGHPLAEESLALNTPSRLPSWERSGEFMPHRRTYLSRPEGWDWERWDRESKPVVAAGGSEDGLKEPRWVTDAIQLVEHKVRSFVGITESSLRSCRTTSVSGLPGSLHRPFTGDDIATDFFSRHFFPHDYSLPGRTPSLPAGTFGFAPRSPQGPSLPPGTFGPIHLTRTDSLPFELRLDGDTLVVEPLHKPRGHVPQTVTVIDRHGRRSARNVDWSIIGAKIDLGLLGAGAARLKTLADVMEVLDKQWLSVRRDLTSLATVGDFLTGVPTTTSLPEPEKAVPWLWAERPREGSVWNEASTRGKCFVRLDKILDGHEPFQSPLRVWVTRAAEMDKLLREQKSGEKLVRRDLWPRRVPEGTQKTKAKIRLGIKDMLMKNSDHAQLQRRYLQWETAGDVVTGRGRVRGRFF